MGKVLQYTRDTLRSLVGALGGASDKAIQTQYATPLYSEDELLHSYRSSWIARKIVNLPAWDASRQWRSWQAEDDQIEKIEEEERRLDVRGKVLKAMIQARLFGSSAIYIGTNDSDPSLPLDPNRISKGGITYFSVMPRHLLSAGEIIRDPGDILFGKVGMYTMQDSLGRRISIHPSRLVLFTGQEIPDDTVTSALSGAGDSVLVSTLQAVKNADATAGNVAGLVFEAKIDVVKVPNLMTTLAAGPEFEEQLLNRFSLANRAKGINSTLLLDDEEEFAQKVMSFQGLPDILLSFLQLVSGAADIPVTRLLGQSPAGLNSTGESDIRNYYDHIRSVQELVVTPALAIFDECLIRSALGARPPEVHYLWSSLWQITDKERMELGKIASEIITALVNSGLFPQEAIAKAGTNMFVEHGVMPGLQEEIDQAGGLPDYEAELEAEREREAAIAQASNVTKLRAADAEPRSLYVRRDVVNRDDLARWAKSQGFELIDDPHVTIMYSREPVDWMKMGDDWGDDDKGRMTIPPGGPRMLDVFDGGAKVLLISSSRLSWRHEDMKRNGAKHSRDEFSPHITLTYEDVEGFLAKEPYRGEIVLGPEIFEEVNDDWKSTL